MGNRKKVPEDLMGTILGEAPGVSSGGRTLSESRGADQKASLSSSGSEAIVFWEEKPERVGITFNLSKQLGAELDRLRQELRPEGDVSLSRSEITEVALRIAVEEVRKNGGESELAKRLGEPAVDQTAGVTGEDERTTRRSVDEIGFIVETTYDENGDVVDEEVIAAIADLPVETEYVDEEGRLVSLAKDELGNTFEQIMDEELNTLGTRLLPDTTDRDAGTLQP